MTPAEARRSPIWLHKRARALAAARATAGVPADLSHDPPGPAVLCFRDPDNVVLEFFEES
ncbi:MAG TPA: hypothetical protein VEL03_17975 [Streptosporangiaceae bacterium]|nr:hypothetical protein [Streptosporangiaceae bacterium]